MHDRKTEVSKQNDVKFRENYGGRVNLKIVFPQLTMTEIY